ncbi:hypothetical protein EJ02DRAFT_418805 [Clathrospora elynae]|uniref:Uncharacterized protein n=1 Tax=Clathrospora elynae TaxID=706981 RepID=A0A6A5T6J0_9PLEO|nr:hypothetical protein EJ02DRAFT_418805 [Clathrospora elynae]
MTWQHHKQYQIFPPTQKPNLMAQIEQFPLDFDPAREDKRWVFPGDAQIPLFFTGATHTDIKDALNLFFLYSGFAVSIKNRNQNKPSKKNP